jgi:hypothetical protein
MRSIQNAKGKMQTMAAGKNGVNNAALFTLGSRSNRGLHLEF